MSDLKAVIGDQKVERWLEYKDGFELKIRHSTRRAFHKLQKELQELDPQEKDIQAVKKLVTDWRGLTIRKVVGFCAVEKVEDKDLDKEIPFDAESFDTLVRAIEDTLDGNLLTTFIIAKSTNHANFKPDNWSKLVKNSGSGLSGSSVHKNKPAQNA